MLRLRSSLNQVLGREDFHLPGLRRALARLPWRPDLVHFHNLHGFNHRTHFDPALLPLLTADTPGILTLHDAWLMTGHCAHFFDCQRWKEDCGACPHLDTYPEIRRDRTAENLGFKRRSLASSRLEVVGVCEWITEQARHSVLAGAARSWSTIHNGFDADEADRYASTQVVPKEALVLCYASEMGHRNQFRDFAGMREACLMAARRLGRPVVALELGAQERFVERHGLCEFRSLGFVDRAGVYGALKSSQVLLHAATADTCPSIIFEAMSAGLPVVASSVCGIPEQVVHGETGLLVGKGDRGGLADALCRLALEPDLAVGMGGRGRERLSRLFSRERMAESYLSLASRLVTS